MKTLLLPTYFSPISQYVAIAKSEGIVFEIEDNYQKQTYRSRCNIYGANGKLQLNIPVVRSNQEQHQKTKDIKIDNSSKWQQLHAKALQSAYRSSPYFEFYEEDLQQIFHKNYTYLLDLNLRTFEVIIDLLQEEITYQKTTSYTKECTFHNDLRHLAIAKKEPDYSLTNYTQVFDDKHGFIANLSILDLLFMEGPNAFNYLENQQITF